MSRLTARNTAVCVIDMQRLESHRFEENKWDPLVFNIRRITEESRSRGLPIIHIFLNRRAPSNYGPYQCQTVSDPCVMRESDGQLETLNWQFQLADGCTPVKGDWMYVKNNANAFEDGDFLKREERFMDTKNLILMGVHTHDCVLDTALGADKNNYHVIVPTQTTDSPYNRCPDKEQYLTANLKTGMEIPRDLQSVIDRMHSTKQGIGNLFKSAFARR